MKPLPQWLRDALASPPRGGGDGLHPWIYRMACELKAHGRSDDEITALLGMQTSGCARDCKREIREALRSAPSTAGLKPGQFRWPNREPERIQEAFRSGTSAADLWEMSPLRLEPPSEPTWGLMLGELFPGDPLLCLGWSVASFDTRPLSAWLAQSRAPQFIVPSPMTKVEGRSQSGSPSRRCNDNTGPRRFLVVEFDFVPDKNPEDQMLLKWGNEHGLLTPYDLCACLLAHLAKEGPLVLAVQSGGKSVHGWFLAEGVEEGRLRSFFGHACRLGADHATWTPCQLVRLPYGLRDGRIVQKPIFFDPSLLQ